MSSARHTVTNKLGAGYHRQPVFGPAGAAALRNFAPGFAGANRRGGSIWADVDAASRAAGGHAMAPAAIRQNQAFSMMAGGQVAQPSSHGHIEMADFCGFAGTGRHITSFATMGPGAGFGQLAGGRRPPEGGRSPLRDRANCLPGSRASDQPWVKTCPFGLWMSKASFQSGRLVSATANGVRGAGGPKNSFWACGSGSGSAAHDKAAMSGAGNGPLVLGKGHTLESWWW